MFGGGKENPTAHIPDNLVWLTLPEHFVAHHLLARIPGGKLAVAFMFMCNRRFPQNKRYARAKAEGLAARNADPNWIANNLTAHEKRWTLEERKRMGDKLKKSVGSETWKESHAIAMARRKADPEWQAKHHSWLQKLHADPEHKEKLRRKMLELNADPERQAKCAAALGAIRDTPEFKARLMVGGRKRSESATWRKNQTAAMKRLHADPVYWSTMKAAIDARSKDPAWLEANRAAVERRLKTVIGECIDTGEILTLRGKQAIIAAGFCHKQVSACCKGKNKSHKGYRWQYEQTAPPSR
jgi:hypothetical protein